jgi:hypothetical protein
LEGLASKQLLPAPNDQDPRSAAVATQSQVPMQMGEWRK